MDLRRLRVNDWLLGAFGLTLLGSLFLEWYEGPVEGAYSDRAIGGDAAGVVVAWKGGASAWEAFAVTDVVLALAATMAMAVWVATVFTTTPALPVTFNTLTALVSGLAALWLSVRVLSLPGDVGPRSVGASVGPVLAWMLAISSWSAMRNERPGRAPMRDIGIEELQAPPPAGA